MKDNFVKLYDKYFDSIYRYIYFKTGSKWDADDLVSETFRKAYEKFNTLKGSPKAWLVCIARNTVNDYYRGKKEIAIESEELDGYSYDYSFEEAFENKEELSMLKSKLKQLQGDELEIINLKYFSGLRYKEIGKILGKTEAAVKVKSNRITRKLAKLLGSYMEG